MSRWKQEGPRRVVGHRGAPRRARENTLESFDWAESLGADAVEMDVRQTRDGEAVVYHDDGIALGTQRVPVRDFTWREIERLTPPSEFGEYRIPRLQDVFQRFGTQLDYVVEVKVGSATHVQTMARRIATLADAYSVGAHVIVASFDAPFLRRMRETAPEIATSFLFDRPVALPEGAEVLPLFPPVDAIGPRLDLVTTQLVAKAASAGLRVHPWTVNDEAEMRRLYEMGCASVTTDAPEIARMVRDAMEDNGNRERESVIGNR
jgi:glycerophosphoryl diester phosphodiesterase